MYRILIIAFLTNTFFGFAQCFQSYSITQPNYASDITQTRTSLFISSQVSRNHNVVLEANQTNGYVLMNPGFLALPNSGKSFSAFVSPFWCNLSSVPKSLNEETDLTLIDEMVLLYPNPTQDILNIQTPYSDWSYRIIGIDGKEISSNQHINSQSFQINTSHLTNGLYLLMISDTKSHIDILKFIKD